MKKLPRTFYTRPTLRVARELPGKYLIRKSRGRFLAGMIVEVEAYLGERDPASHAFNGPTKRNEVMFFEGGHLYVYFTYGMHHCCNVVTGRNGIGRAVLIRAIEPVAGIETMRRNRWGKTATGQKPAAPDLGNGPGKLCQSLGISMKENGTDLTGDRIYIASADPPGRQNHRSGSPPITATTRIGIRKGTRYKWRYFITGSEYSSRGKPSRRG